MSPLPDDDRDDLYPGEAMKRCLKALDPLRPDYQAAQVYATLALRDSVDDLTKQIQLAARRH